MFSKSCTTLALLLVACHGNAQSDDTDEQTIAWLAETFPQDAQNNRNVDLSPTNQNKKEVDDIVNWFKESVQPDPKNKMKPGKINLDPDNVEIKNTSFSHPAETSNKFDNTIESTTAPAAPCETEDGRAGVCVLYYQCDPDTRKVIGDGTHLIDIRIGGPCSHYLDVCCRLEDRVSPSTSTASPASPTHLNKGTKPVQDVLPMATDVAVGGAGECGWNNPDLFVFQPASQDVADRGVYANYGDFPWMVALLRKSGTDVWVQDDYIGGGSLIHPSVVMTALHKLLQVTPEELKCRAGEWDTQTDREEFKIQERDADRFVSHKEFFRASVYNDIALVFLKAPFELARAPHIGAACLARVLPSHADCFSMGWGKDVQSSQYVHILKKVKLSLVERKTCQELLHTNTRFRHIPNFMLHESLTCAGGEQYVDTCQGDGGSPLVCPIGHRDGRTRYAVVGMVAYGLACGKQNVPGVYVNVPHLYDWVEQQMKDAGYDSSTFSY